MEGTGVEWRGGQGRAGQGARLLRWTFTGRDFIPLNTPWNGQPPSCHYGSSSLDDCAKLHTYLHNLRLHNLANKTNLSLTKSEV